MTALTARETPATHQEVTVAQTPIISLQATPAIHQAVSEEAPMTLIPQAQPARLAVNQADTEEAVTLMDQETLATHQEVMEEAMTIPTARGILAMLKARVVIVLPASCSRRQATCSRTITWSRRDRQSVPKPEMMTTLMETLAVETTEAETTTTITRWITSGYDCTM
jgi:hypothetical protein